MSKSIQALREKRNAQAKEVQSLLEANKGAEWKKDPQNQVKYDEFMASIVDLDDEIKREEDTLKLITDEAEVATILAAADKHAIDKKSPSAKYLSAWLKGGDKALTAEQHAEIQNAMSTTGGSGSEGGYTIQSDVARVVIETMLAFGGMSEVATILNMNSGNPLNWPTSDETSEEGEIIAENASATDNDDVSFGTIGITPYKFSSKVVPIPFELIQDSGIDIEAFVIAKLAERIARSTNRFQTTGTGTAQPSGVVTRASAGKTGASGQTTTVIADDLIDLIHSVDPAYRQSSNCRFMMHDLSLAKIRKLKDADGRPIFIPGYEGLSGAMSDRLLGYDITINQHMAEMAANAKSILFGDFKKYIIRNVMEAQVFRFADSAYIKKGQIGFLLWARSGGNLVDTSAVKYYANAAS